MNPRDELRFIRRLPNGRLIYAVGEVRHQFPDRFAVARFAREHNLRVWNRWRN